MNHPLQVFIGYDSKEPVAYHVLSHSILRQAKSPVSIQPLALDHLGGIYTRKRGPTESTEFSISRFLVPYLSDYEGYSIFMDCDMLVRTDLHELLDLVDGDKSVWVCPHDYTPKTDTKFLGQVQTKYPRKNWSSLMVFNNAWCQNLTPEYVNEAGGLELHRFHWVPNDEIGYLPLEWNWLVGEYDYNPNAKVVHYTLGGPWFPEYVYCDYSGEWRDELSHLLHPLEAPSPTVT